MSRPLESQFCPISADAFNTFMTCVGLFEPAPHVAVAVSGGADSMALLHLLKNWARHQGGRVTALTVDHGLRPESSKEAQQIAVWCAALGVDHQILTWDGPKPATGIQQTARNFRYDAMIKKCHVLGIQHLCVGHHMDDQIETFLMRLEAGSGLDGLACMRPVREMDGVRLCRPLLSVSKQALYATCRAFDVDWIEDPSNHNPSFARTRIRALRPHLDISAAQLARTVTAFSMLRGVLDRKTDEMMRTVVVSTGDHVVLDGAALQSLPDEVQRRVLERVLMSFSGQSYPPRSERLARLLKVLQGDFKSYTLSGCLITAKKGDKICISSESRRS